MEREPSFLYRRGRRAILEISSRLHVPTAGAETAWLSEENFDVAWRGLAELGLPLRAKAHAWADLQALRASYGDALERLIDFLVAPRGFWGHSAEETVAAEVREAAAEARRNVLHGQAGAAVTLRG
jgi:hypothetical protein